MTTPAPMHPKITAAHLARKAIVYLRQSSDKQVRANKESQRLQYALADRARELGWKQVEVIDADLGASATLGAAQRDGFEGVIASVALGEVGIVFSRELSRLTRTDKDWCQLMEVCSVFDTRVGDGEQIYDLHLMDDQLILGIKGTLSVVELKVLNLRLQQGMEAKARRGELKRLLGPGYVHDREGKIVKDPDERVREAVGLLFRKYRETWSVRQTFRWFHDEGVTLPVNKTHGSAPKIEWQLPTQSFVSSVLHNPVYAGAYVYGRRPTEMILKDGRLRKRSGGPRDAEGCRVFIRDHHEAYIDWVTYEENQRTMRRNAIALSSEESVATARAGQGLLVGLLRCGRCGRKLHVRYWGRSGTAARYLCLGDFPSGGSYCLGFGGAGVDRRISQELLEVLSPLGVAASLVALETLSRKGDDRQRARALQLQQLEQEARRAFEQYDEVDPRNRLVATELERRWDEKLKQVEQLKDELGRSESEPPALSAEDRQRVVQLGENFALTWQSTHCPPELRKKIARSVLEEAIVNLNDDTKMLTFVLHWKGGTHTQFEMEKPRSGVGRKTSLEDLELIRVMAVRYEDGEIARVLNKLGRRTGKDKRWSKTRVATARRNHSIPSRDPAAHDPEILSLGQAARHCGVSGTTVKRLKASGLLRVEQVAPWAPWEIRRCDLDSEPLKSVLVRLRKTGKLVLEGVGSSSQPHLFQ